MFKHAAVLQLKGWQSSTNLSICLHRVYASLSPALRCFMCSSFVCSTGIIWHYSYMGKWHIQVGVVHLIATRRNKCLKIVLYPWTKFRQHTGKTSSHHLHLSLFPEKQAFIFTQFEFKTDCLLPWAKLNVCEDVLGYVVHLACTAVLQCQVQHLKYSNNRVVKDVKNRILYCLSTNEVHILPVD